MSATAVQKAVIENHLQRKIITFHLKRMYPQITPSDLNQTNKRVLFSRTYKIDFAIIDNPFESSLFWDIVYHYLELKLGKSKKWDPMTIFTTFERLINAKDDDFSIFAQCHPDSWEELWTLIKQLRKFRKKLEISRMKGKNTMIQIVSTLNKRQNSMLQEIQQVMEYNIKLISKILEVFIRFYSPPQREEIHSNYFYLVTPSKRPRISGTLPYDYLYHKRLFYALFDWKNEGLTPNIALNKGNIAFNSKILVPKWRIKKTSVYMDVTTKIKRVWIENNRLNLLLAIIQRFRTTKRKPETRFEHLYKVEFSLIRKTAPKYPKIVPYFKKEKEIKNGTNMLPLVTL